MLIHYLNEIKHSLRMRMIERVLTRTYKQFNLGNLAFGLAKGDEIIMKKYYGCRNHENEEMNDKTLIRWGSISKIATGLMVMRAHRDKILNLDDNINKYINFQFPKKINKKRKEGNVNDYVPIHKSPRVTKDIEEAVYKRIKVTVRDLLTHRSGMLMPLDLLNETQQHFDKLKFYEKDGMPIKDGFLISNKVFHKLAEAWALPETETIYNNYSHYLAAEILVKASGKDYLSNVKKYIRNDNKSELCSLFPDYGDRYKYTKFDDHNYEYHRVEGFTKSKPVLDNSDISMFIPSVGFMSNLDDALTFTMRLGEEIYLTKEEKSKYWEKTGTDLDYNHDFGTSFELFHNPESIKFGVGHLGSITNGKSIFKHFPNSKYSYVVFSSDNNLPFDYISGGIETYLL